jgi:hypothetical protein
MMKKLSFTEHPYVESEKQPLSTDEFCDAPSRAHDFYLNEQLQGLCAAGALKFD